MQEKTNKKAEQKAEAVNAPAKKLTKNEQIEAELAEGDSYKVSLSNFDGPLDLLLFLIKEAKIDIKDIFVSQITEQFLTFVAENKDNLPLQKIGDFLETSATLLEIKSRKLLPKPEVELPEEDDPEKRLIARLEEYKLFKEKSETLQALDDMGKFYKAPEPDATGYRYELPKDLSFDKLLDAFAQIMHKIQVKAELPEPKKIVKDRFTVAQKMTEIKDLISAEPEVKFSSLYAKDYSKSEIINTFLALLELLKLQQICVKQPEQLGEILITKKEQN